MDNVQAGVTVVVIVAGAGLSFAGLLSLGAFSAFILFLPILMRAITNLAAYVQDLGRATEPRPPRSRETRFLPGLERASTQLERLHPASASSKSTSATPRTAPTSAA